MSLASRRKILFAAICSLAVAPAAPAAERVANGHSSSNAGIVNQSEHDSSPRLSIQDSVTVTEKPLTLREIIKRCVEGERTKLSGHQTMSYTLVTRTFVIWKKKKEIHENVIRIFQEAGQDGRVVQLDERTTYLERQGNEWVPKGKEKDEDEGEDKQTLTITVTADEYSEFEKTPFFLEEQQEFDFELLDRIVENDHVILKIGFKPKSSFKPLPSGTVYVDSNEFRIIHEVFRFDHNPLPLFLKGINRISRHWTQLPGGEWVYDKIMMDLDIRFGWGDKIPHKVSVAVLRENFAFDQPYDEKAFGKR